MCFNYRTNPHYPDPKTFVCKALARINAVFCSTVLICVYIASIYDCNVCKV